MKRPDDCSVSASDLQDIRKQADQLLREAGAYGRFPTPIEDIVAAAKLRIDYDSSLDETFLRRVYRSVTEPIKRAIDKVVGLFDSRDRMIYLDLTAHDSKKTFVKLHETGHGYLPWQRDTYAFMEDGESTLDPEITEVFERQANVFASEVLFQLDLFQEDAASRPFELKTPLALASRYGASAYATIRRYVTTSPRACAVLVLDPPVYQVGLGETYSVRRPIQSARFTEKFGRVTWPAMYVRRDPLGAKLPQGRFNQRFTKRCQIDLLATGSSEKFYLEAFDSKFAVFALIYPVSELKAAKVAV